MKYLKRLLSNFLTVFFANYILAGIQVVNCTKIPHVGSDLLFSACLGLLNTSIYSVLRIFNRNVTLSQIAIFCFILNFFSYSLLKLLPIGIEIRTVEGYLFASLAITIVSFLTNFLEARGKHHKPEEPPNEL